MIRSIIKNSKHLALSLIAVLLFNGGFIQSSATALINEPSLPFIANQIQTLYNDDNSLLSNEANTVLQTDDGMIWIGAYSGLHTYDGKKMTKVTQKSHKSFTAQSIRALYESRDKTFYIASNDEGLFSYKEGLYTSIKDATGKLSTSVRNIFEDQKGQLYITTTSGLGKVENGQLTVVENEAFHNEFLISGTTDQSNRVWTVSDGGNLYILESGKLIQTLTPKNFDGQNVTQVYCDSNNRVFIGTNSDTVWVHQPSNDFKTFRPFSLSGLNKTSTIYEDSQQRVWIGGEGLYGYFSKDLNFSPVSNSLINGFVESVFQDYEGNIWIVSSKQGVLKLTQSKFLNLSMAKNIDPMSINTTLFWNNQLYLGTDKGLLILDEHGLVNNALSESLKGVRVRALKADRLNQLWIATYGSTGLIQYRLDQKIKSWNESNGLTKNKVRTIFESQDGSIYAATTEGITVIKNDQVIKTYTEKEGLSNPYILSLCQDEKGILYAGSDGGGIYRINGNTLTHLTEKDGLPSGVILRMAYDLAHQTLFISSGGQLCLWKNGTPFQVLTNLNIEGNIFDIQISGNQLILLTSSGLSMLSISELLEGRTPTVTTFDKHDGLSSFPVANAWNDLTPSGDLYISGGEGVYQLNIHRIYKNTIQPKAKINSVEIDGVLYTNLNQLELPTGAQRISFDVSILSFNDPESNQIEYALEGFDRVKIKKRMSQIKEISYTNLNGGNYTFELSGSNADGLDTKTVSTLAFRKKLGIWETPFPYLLIILVFILLTYSLTRLYFKLREVKLIQKQKAYKEITDQAIEAISRTIDAKDHYTSGHSQRVANYSIILGKAIGLDEETLESLYYSALLHDIGKIGVPDEVLNKAMHLTTAEFDMIKHHVTKGNEILKDFKNIDGLSEGALYHHEKYDGTGYVYGLNGQEIPINARIIAIADAYDAMGTKRPYRDALPQSIILSEFRKNSGIQFDPEIVEKMCDLIESGLLESALNENIS